MYGGELRNVEVNRVGVHKGRGLEWLAHHLGCTLANVIAIGDSENDLTMLQMAGLGVAMANSEPCIREAADVITAAIWKTVSHRRFTDIFWEDER